MSYLYEPANRAAGVAALEKSLALDPNREEAAFYLAQYLTHDGPRHRDVRRLSAALLARTTNEAMKELLVTMLAIASVNGAVEQANAGHYAEALALIDAVLPGIRDANVRREALGAREMIAARAKQK